MIKVGDGRSLKVEGAGNIKLKVKSTTNNTINFTIEEALFDPTLSTNLISIGKLAKKGYKILFEKDVCNIKLNEIIVIEGVQSDINDNLYELKRIDVQALVATETSNWKIWHQR